MIVLNNQNPTMALANLRRTLRLHIAHTTTSCRSNVQSCAQDILFKGTALTTSEGVVSRTAHEKDAVWGQIACKALQSEQRRAEDSQDYLRMGEYSAYCPTQNRMIAMSATTV